MNGLPKEGLRWLRKNPVVLSATAAAATAAAIYSYLSQPEAIARTVRWVLYTQSSGCTRQRSSHLCTCAAVSWSDDHGGKLASVFTEEQEAVR